MEVLSKHRGRLVRARGDWQGQGGTEATIGTKGTDKGKRGQRPHALADKGKRRPDARPTKIGILRKCTRTQKNTLLISHSPFNAGNASLFVCLHGCPVACASCATKQTFAQCRIFLVGTLVATPSVSVNHPK